MPKTFPLAVKERALELYLQGSSPKDVSEVLRDEFSNDVTQSTVYAWVKQEGWEEKKQLVYADSLVHIQESEGQKLNRIQQEHWEGYSTLRHKATHELEFLQFDKDNLAEKLGTTSKGIAPCYAAKAGRTGILAEDVLEEQM